jgi:uncharacterized integral membrane protein
MRMVTDEAPVATPSEEPPSASEGVGRVPSTRASRVWVAVAVLLVVLALVLLFILQNLHRARVTYFTAHWTAPLAVDLLLAAVLGGLVVAMAGAIRIAQLRIVVRRHRRARVRAEQHNA